MPKPFLIPKYKLSMFTLESRHSSSLASNVVLMSFILIVPLIPQHILNFSPSYQPVVLGVLCDRGLPSIGVNGFSSRSHNGGSVGVILSLVGEQWIGSASVMAVK